MSWAGTHMSTCCRATCFLLPLYVLCVCVVLFSYVIPCDVYGCSFWWFLSIKNVHYVLLSINNAKKHYAKALVEKAQKWQYQGDAQYHITTQLTILTLETKYFNNVTLLQAWQSMFLIKFAFFLNKNSDNELLQLVREAFIVNMRSFWG